MDGGREGEREGGMQGREPVKEDNKGGYLNKRTRKTGKHKLLQLKTCGAENGDEPHGMMGHKQEKKRHGDIPTSANSTGITRQEKCTCEAKKLVPMIGNRMLVHLQPCVQRGGMSHSECARAKNYR